MIFVKITVLLTVLVAAGHGEEDDSNNQLSNSLDETTVVESASSSSPQSNLSRQSDDAVARPQPSSFPLKANDSQKNRRRARYLRQLPPYRPPRNRRRPPSRRAPPPPPPRNRFKPGRPYPAAKSPYRYYREQWRQKWTDHNQPSSAYGPPYSFDDDDGLTDADPASLPYDEYGEDDVDDVDYKMEDDPYSTRKYRGYDDVVPQSSSTRYSNEKRRPYFEHRPRSARIRGATGGSPVAYDEYDAWPDRAERPLPRYTKPYREYPETIRSKKLHADANDIYQVGGGASMATNHRFKFGSHPAATRFNGYDDVDDYELAALNALKKRRLRDELVAGLVRVAKPYADEVPSRYESAKYNGDKTADGADVVYSAKYRGGGAADAVSAELNQQKAEEDEKPDAEPSKASAADGNTAAAVDWKHYQPVAYHQQTMAKYDRDTAAESKGQSFKSQQRLLPNELIAYMSADPSEPVIGKEQRYLETASYPYDVLKSTLLRKMSPVIDHDLEVVFEDRTNNWRH